MASDRLRVTWLCLEWPREGEHVGGVGRYCLRMAQRLEHLVDLTVVAYVGAVPMDGVRLVTIPAPAGRIERYYVSPWRARRAVAATEPQVVHAHGDDWLMGGRRIRSFYGSSLGEARSSSGLRKLNHYVLAATETVSQYRARLRIGIAPESVDRFRCQVTMPPYLPPLHDMPMRRPTPEPTVVFIGSYHGRKQGWLAQRAVEALRRSDRPDARLIVVGPEPDARSWAPWVEHRAGLDDAAVQDLLARCWLLVSPSLYEGFGIPVIEALAAGAPVVALRNAGSRYLESLGDPDLPLSIADDAERFVGLVSARVRRGPDLREGEVASAGRMVARATDAGSAERLVELYQREEES